MSATFTIRPARMDEVETATELLNEHSRRLHGVDDQTVDELRRYWESPEVEFPDDVLLAEGSDGEIVGYADIGLWGGHVWLDVRGLDQEPLSALLDAIEARAADKKPGVDLMVYVTEEDKTIRDLYEQAGYRIVRHSFRMMIELDEGLPEPAWPEGVTVRTLREGEEERVYDVHMATFADAWLFSPEPYEGWAHWFLKDEAFDPSLWFLAEAAGELVGIALTRESPSEPGLGWVRILGVVREHRRRGIGEALLQHAFREFARRGLERVSLGVDAESPTGAVRLYERAGMHVARTNLQLKKAVQG